jgi:ribosomal protein L28
VTADFPIGTVPEEEEEEEEDGGSPPRRLSRSVFSLSLSLSVCVCVCVCVYIRASIIRTTGGDRRRRSGREREREREREKGERLFSDFIRGKSGKDKRAKKKSEKSAFLLLLLLDFSSSSSFVCGKNATKRELERKKEDTHNTNTNTVMSSKHASKQLGTKLQNLLVVCGRAKRGLYHGKTVRFGNNVSEDGGNKTRRKWSPNAKRKRLYSEVLDRMVSVQVTAHALRCIDKAGGLDNYVLNTSAEKMASLKGLELKDKMMRALLEVDAAEVNDEQLPPPPPPKSD